MTTIYIFWAVIFVLTVLAEFATMQLVSVWFSVGSLGALIAAMLGLGFTGQLAVFVLVSLLLLAVTRPILRKLRVQKIIPTNAEQEVGEQAVVIETIDRAAGTGRVRRNGVDWMAIASDNTVIPVDTVVVVTEVQGAKLFVRRQTTTVASGAKSAS